MNGFITFIMLIVVTIPLIASQCFHTDKMLLFPQSSFVFLWLPTFSFYILTAIHHIQQKLGLARSNQDFLFSFPFPFPFHFPLKKR